MPYQQSLFISFLLSCSLLVNLRSGFFLVLHVIPSFNLLLPYSFNYTSSPSLSHSHSQAPSAVLDSPS